MAEHDEARSREEQGKRLAIVIAVLAALGWSAWWLVG
jgi:hypothetical protein